MFVIPKPKECYFGRSIQVNVNSERFLRELNLNLRRALFPMRRGILVEVPVTIKNSPD